MATSPHAALSVPHIPLLEAGDHLDQTTFHERYKAMPPGFRAELIGGIVFVPSPLSLAHGAYHALVMGWLTNYWVATPGTEALDNATAILGSGSEPQPDGALLIDPACGGQTGVSEDGYATGAPELIVEVVSSSASTDLHAKRRDYEQAGVLEYIVVVIRQRTVRWFSLQQDAFQERTIDANGIFQSAVFPGLWLHADALLNLDGQQVMDTLQQGLATPLHAAFVQRLQARRGTV
jgi:Uma2 family endonuclease